jgi:hypothetical protein
MLRWAIVLLAMANLLYFGWTQGLLGDPQGNQREPERLQAQVQPQMLRLMNSPAPATPAPVSAQAEAGSAPASSATGDQAPAAPATRCWVASGFNPPQAQALRSAMESTGLPASAWRLDEVRLGGRWIVYMGRYNAEQMARKKLELRELKVEFREVNIAAGPGLALGTFSTEEAAEQGLRDLGRKGVRTARVEPERGEVSSYVLRLPAVTEAQRAEVAALGAALAGKPLQPCE